MFRFILIFLSLLIYLLVFSPLMLVLLLISRYNNKLSAKISQFLVKHLFRFILFISGVKVEISGLENIPTNEAVLFVSNHKSCFDVVLAYAYTPKLFGFISKIQMQKYILLRQWMYLLNCIFLDRDDIKQGLKSILKAIEKIKDGYSIWVCPEGTRLVSDNEKDILDFKEGSFKIAEKAKKAIVPVVLKNTRSIFEKQAPIIKPVKVCIEYLKPIYIDELDKEERKRLGLYTKNLIQNRL